MEVAGAAGPNRLVSGDGRGGSGRQDGPDEVREGRAPCWCLCACVRKERIEGINKR